MFCSKGELIAFVENFTEHKRFLSFLPTPSQRNRVTILPVALREIHRTRFSVPTSRTTLRVCRPFCCSFGTTFPVTVSSDRRSTLRRVSTADESLAAIGPDNPTARDSRRTVQRGIVVMRVRSIDPAAWISPRPPDITRLHNPTRVTYIAGVCPTPGTSDGEGGASVNSRNAVIAVRTRRRDAPCAPVHVVLVSRAKNQ